ncbi:MAG: hypothetical protein EBZ77_17170, partial [Chitinophagia bacterium]|nr:hypothetical protein [Chitinophagia bacterium]
MYGMNLIRFFLHIFLLLPAFCLKAQWLETTVQLPPQASARDLIYNPLNERIYTANRLTFNISVSRDSLDAPGSVRAWNANGQVFIVWKTDAQAP